MRAPRSFAFVVALTSLIPAGAQAFCGFYVSGADAQLFNNATQVVLLRDGTTTVMSMQNDYEGPPSRFAMVVPVPVVLQKDNVKTLPREIFSRLDSLAAPRLVEYWEQDPCRQLRRHAEAMLGGAPPSMSMRKSAPKKKELGVTVEAQFTVGEYEIVILSAKDSGGLEEWLRLEKYTIPKGAEPYLRPYVQQGSKFFVAKVDVTKVKFDGNRAVLSPLRFNYQSKDFKLPVRLGMMNSQGTQDLLVHILAKNQRYEVSNRPNTTIPTNLNLKEAARGRFGEFYAALFDRVVAANKGAVVTEYAWDSSTCDPCPVPALKYSELLTLGLDIVEGVSMPLGVTPTKPQVPPPLKTTGKKGDIVSELMAAPVAVPVTPAKTGGVAMPPPWMKRKRRRIRGSARGWVLTRLHARYTKDGLDDDLVFKTAPPIAGGRERYVGQDRSLPEQGASPDRRNNFQGRYAIRHEWQGAIECENPRRGVWGGPPNGSGPKPLAAKDTAMAPRGKIALASVVARGLSKELMAAPDPAAETGTEAKPGGAAGAATGGGPGPSTASGKGGAAPPDSVPPLQSNCATLRWGVTRAWPWLRRR